MIGLLKMRKTAKGVMERTHKFSADNYHPLPVVLKSGKNIHVWDIEGREYIDMLSAYSALNFGHNHPRLVEALVRQSSKLSITSRAFYSDVFAEFVERLARFCFLDKVLPMNSGAEAVETAIKIARKWGYSEAKGVEKDKAEIIVCDNNFHGRTTTIVGFSSTPQYRDGFGPFAPGFISVPFGDVTALKNAITENTVAFLVEPIQGEGGINVPPDDYLSKVSRICRSHNILFAADEIQTGLGRTGKKFCFWHQCLSPDLLIVGKALGGGLLPISAVVGKKEVMDVIRPGDHGSTFGGNPLACAVAVEALKVLEEEELADNALCLGKYFREQLRSMDSRFVKEVRGKGLLVGVELLENNGRDVCEKMLEAGILCKETRDNVVRLAPPLTITKKEINEALEKIKLVLRP